MKKFALRPRHVAAAALVAAALPFAAVATANASTYEWGCTVTPLRPVFDHINPANGNKVIRYDYRITCSAGRSIEVDQHIHEEDPAPNADDHWTSNTRSESFPTTRTVTKGWLHTLPAGEVGAEEVYHQVSFRVTPDNLSQSGWTAFEASAVQQFTN